jgi:hypothetical protein
LRETERKYHVSIDDKGGHWTTKGLSGISEGMERLHNSIGGARFNKLFDGVRFSFGGDANNMWTTGHRDVVVGSGVMNNQSYLEQYTVHEFAHIWDNTCNDCLSKGLMAATGSWEENVRLSDKAYGIKYHAVGDTASTYAEKNRLEDWAESLSVYLDPDSPKLYTTRMAYVAARIAFGGP